MAKALYYFYLKINKFYVNWGFQAIKLASTLIHGVATRNVLGIDAQYCYWVPAIGEELGPLCAAVWFYVVVK